MSENPGSPQPVPLWKGARCQKTAGPIGCRLPRPNLEDRPGNIRGIWFTPGTGGVADDENLPMEFVGSRVLREDRYEFTPLHGPLAA